MQMKRIAILGSTGSIGRQTLDVVSAHPDKFQVAALAGGSNIELVAEQVAQFSPFVVSVATESGARLLCDALKSRRAPAAPMRSLTQTGRHRTMPEVLFGAEGLKLFAPYPDAETVVSDAVGVVGLPATFKAIQLGKHIALANKEVLVAAGEVAMAAVKRSGGALLPGVCEHK